MAQCYYYDPNGILAEQQQQYIPVWGIGIQGPVSPGSAAGAIVGCVLHEWHYIYLSTEIYHQHCHHYHLHHQITPLTFIHTHRR